MKRDLNYIVGITGMTVGCASLAILALSVLVFVCTRPGYYVEMNEIKGKLNRIPNVSVLDIWGHDDISLEEVTARLSIKDKGEMVLYGLSEDVKDYPDRIPISEIGGLSFVLFRTNSVGFSLDIGQKGPFSQSFPFVLANEEEVVGRYDYILAAIHSWPSWPKLHHIHPDNGEEIFLSVIPKKTKDQDPIYTPYDVESLFKFKDRLPWGRIEETKKN